MIKKLKFWINSLLYLGNHCVWRWGVLFKARFGVDVNQGESKHACCCGDETGQQAQQENAQQWPLLPLLLQESLKPSSSTCDKTEALSPSWTCIFSFCYPQQCTLKSMSYLLMLSQEMIRHEAFSPPWPFLTTSTLRNIFLNLSSVRHLSLT